MLHRIFIHHLFVEGPYA